MSSDAVTWMHFDKKSKRILGIDRSQKSSYGRRLVEKDISGIWRNSYKRAVTVRCHRKFASQTTFTFDDTLDTDDEGFVYFANVERHGGLSSMKKQCGGVYFMSVANYLHRPRHATFVCSSDEATKLLDFIDVTKSWCRFHSSELCKLSYHRVGTTSWRFLTYTFASSEIYLKFMMKYFNEYYDDLPHDLDVKVTDEMYAAECAAIEWSQYPPEDPIVESTIAWDIETGCNDISLFPKGSRRSNYILCLAAYHHYGCSSSSNSTLYIFMQVSCARQRDFWSKRVEDEVLEALRVAHPRSAVRLIVCNDDVQLIDKFIGLIEDLKPTVICGYNTSGFDTKFLKEKLEAARQWASNDEEQRSYVESVLKRLTVKKFVQKSFLDTQKYDLFYPPAMTKDVMLEMVQQSRCGTDKNFDELQRNSLEYFAQKHLGDKKVEVPGGTAKFVYVSQKLLIQGYNVLATDAQACAEIRQCVENDMMQMYPNELDGGNLDEKIIVHLLVYCAKDSILTFNLMNRFNLVATDRLIARTYGCPIADVCWSGNTKWSAYHMRNVYEKSKIVNAARRTVKFGVKPFTQFEHYIEDKTTSSLVVAEDEGNNSSCSNSYELTSGDVQRLVEDVGIKTAWILRYYCPWHLQKFHFPRYEGAIVCARPGVYDNVGTGDLNSLYPNCMVAYNICQTKICKRHRQRVGVDGVSLSSSYTEVKYPDAAGRYVRTCYIQNDEEGVVPKLMRVVLAQRIAVKNQMKNIADESSSAYNALDVEQQALKIVANGTYGALAGGDTFASYRLAAEIVTAYARKVFVNIARALENEKYVVCYGDTDSIMVADVPSAKEFAELTSRLNERLALNLSDRFEIKMEYYTPRMIVISAKRYAYVDPKNPQAIKAKGMKSVRGDIIPFIKRAEMRILHLCLGINAAGKQQTALASVAASNDNACSSSPTAPLFFIRNSRIQSTVSSSCRDPYAPNFYTSTNATTKEKELTMSLYTATVAITREMSSVSKQDLVERKRVKAFRDYRNTNLPHIQAAKQKEDRNISHISNDKVAYVYVDDSYKRGMQKDASSVAAWKCTGSKASSSSTRSRSSRVLFVANNDNVEKLPLHMPYYFENLFNSVKIFCPESTQLELANSLFNFNKHTYPQYEHTRYKIKRSHRQHTTDDETIDINKPGATTLSTTDFGLTLITKNKIVVGGIGASSRKRKICGKRQSNAVSATVSKTAATRECDIRPRNRLPQSSFVKNHIYRQVLSLR